MPAIRIQTLVLLPHQAFFEKTTLRFFHHYPIFYPGEIRHFMVQIFSQWMITNIVAAYAQVLESGVSLCNVSLSLFRRDMQIF